MTKLANFSQFDADPANLQQLSEQVSRIAATLAQIAVAPPTEKSVRNLASRAEGRAAPVAIGVVRQAIKARRLRSQFFDQALFADPAWDMLLDLFEAELTQLRVSVSSLCVAATVPSTTALRWIKSMTDVGLFRRRPDPYDGRRIFIELSPEASDAMRCYFGALDETQSTQ